MIGHKYVSKFDNLLQKNRLLGFALVLMLIFNIFNWMSLQHAQSATRVAIIPPGSVESLEIGNGKANDPYIRKMARYITQQTGTYNAGTIRDQLMELVTLFHPEQVGTAQGEFRKLATQIERYPSISSVVRWSGGKGTLKYTKSVIQVRTLKARLINGSESETHQVYYCIKYRIEDTRFWLISIEEREGNGDDLCLHVPAGTGARASSAP